MAKKPTTTSTTTTKPAKAAPAPAPAPAKSEAAKAETAKAESGAAASGSESAGGSKTAAAPARSISYFSSVATDDYRAGWDSIFGGKKKKGARGGAGRTARARDDIDLPLTLSFDADDLDAATRKGLDALLRREAKKRGLDHARLARRGRINWLVTCRISEA